VAEYWALELIDGTRMTIKKRRAAMGFIVFMEWSPLMWLDRLQKEPGKPEDRVWKDDLDVMRSRGILTLQ